MKRLKTILVLAAWIAANFCSCKKNSGTEKPNIPRPPTVAYEFEPTPAWQEDFSGTSLNTEVWSLHAPGARQDGFNDMTGMSFDGNAFVNKVYSDTTLSGAATHHAGMIRTIQEYKYGKFEAKISFVNSLGSWSAFWLQSATMGNPIGNPKAAGMEIDVVESLSNDGAAYQNLHWDGYGADHKTVGVKTADFGVNSGNYHIYTLEWTPDYYKFYVDGTLTWTYTANVSQRSEFIILSSEVKKYAVGTWAGPIPVNGFGALNRTTTIMKVDYIKYKLK